PHYPTPEFERAWWEVSKKIIENNFSEVTYKKNDFNEDVVIATFPHGKISTFIEGEHTQSPNTGGYLNIAIR
ncbi:MAG: hypothetical protein K6G87_02375, partial [Butyrivibrio sp.]|uniref:hypothetical protein n=1 Tax=Butyrivibrio sp. TaxID=28121 RepID=UPI0025F902F7